MRYIFFSALMLVGNLVNAQFTTNVFWTEQTGMNPEEIVYYKPSRNLTWVDFKGTPGPPSPVAAITSSGFGYKASMQNTGTKGQVNISVYCYFSKDKSWVRPGKTTPYILNHEQHHFDASYLAAMMFMEKVRGAGLTLANYNASLQRIYRECCDIMNKMQNDYDGQTKNGQMQEQQAKWNAFFNDRMSLVTK